MNPTIYEQTKAAMKELCEKAKLRAGNIVVVGCSTSEVVGAKIGTNSNPDVAGEIFRALHDHAGENGLFLAIQCCEHLNRALIMERTAAEAKGYEIVNVMPQPHAGGSMAVTAWNAFADPVAVETIRADAGMDIGGTLIGMHLRHVAVPVRTSLNHIGEAIVLCARTRPKYIGGPRAVYQE